MHTCKQGQGGVQCCPRKQYHQDSARWTLTSQTEYLDKSWLLPAGVEFKISAFDEAQAIVLPQALGRLQCDLKIVRDLRLHLEFEPIRISVQSARTQIYAGPPCEQTSTDTRIGFYNKLL